MNSWILYPREALVFWKILILFSSLLWRLKYKLTKVSTIFCFAIQSSFITHRWIIRYWILFLWWHSLNYACNPFIICILPACETTFSTQLWQLHLMLSIDIKSHHHAQFTHYSINKHSQRSCNVQVITMSKGCEFMPGRAVLHLPFCCLLHPNNATSWFNLQWWIRFRFHKRFFSFNPFHKQLQFLSYYYCVICLYFGLEKKTQKKGTRYEMILARSYLHKIFDRYTNRNSIERNVHKLFNYPFFLFHVISWAVCLFSTFLKGAAAFNCGQ